MNEPNSGIGFNGYHDGKGDNFSCTAAENILGYEINIELGHSPEESSYFTLDRMPGSTTISRYKAGEFENHKIVKCIRKEKQKIADYITVTHGDGCILKMSEHGDMFMTQEWVMTATESIDLGLRKSMAKGSPVTDIYVIDSTGNIVDTISMKIGNSQLSSGSYTDKKLIWNHIADKYPETRATVTELLNPEYNFYQKFPCDIKKITPDSKYWDLRQMYSSMMEEQNRMYTELIESNPEIKRDIARMTLTGDFKFKPGSPAIATTILHLFPDMPEKSYIRPVDDAVDDMIKALYVSEGFKSSSGNTFNAIRAQLTYPKKLLKEMPG